MAEIRLLRGKSRSGKNVCHRQRISIAIFSYPIPPYSYRLDWGYIGPPTENLAASLLADYFSEVSIYGKKSEPEKYQTVRHYFQFYIKVCLYLPYEEWEFRGCVQRPQDLFRANRLNI